MVAAAGVAAGLVVLTASHGPAPRPGNHAPQPDGTSVAVTVCTAPAISCTAAGQGADMKAAPAQISTSADGAEYLTSITWHDWGHATATGTGILEVNRCSRGCTSGSYTGYPATVSLAGLSAYAKRNAAYATMTVKAPRAAGTAPAFSTGLVP